MPKITFIDPPEGWKYGFPKPIETKENIDIKQWLVNNGYPKKVMDEYGNSFHYRMWTKDLTHLDWWANFSYSMQADLMYEYGYGYVNVEDITSPMIYNIWKNETAEPLNDTFQLIDETPESNFKQKVDFLKIVSAYKTYFEKKEISSSERDNLLLFLEMLSKSSTFAHKAHKELKNIL